MTAAPSPDLLQRRRIGRSIVALLVGFAVGAVLALGTDRALQNPGIFPPVGTPWTDGPLLIAAAYRTLYAVLSSYLIAFLAPDRPMQHAMLGGAIGLVLCTLAAIATWNSNLGPHWYPVSLIVLALPPAWLGGRIRVMQLRGKAIAL